MASDLILPKRITANFFLSEGGLGDQVCIDLNQPLRLLAMPPATAYQWADLLLRFARQAEKNQKGRPGMTKKEVERFEESICGTPRLFPGP